MAQWISTRCEGRWTSWNEDFSILSFKTYLLRTMGWVYFIQNQDLFKIGITENLERRMRELQPCLLLKALKTNNPRKLEKILHKKYKSVRIPQTEYFRLSKRQVEEVIAVLDSSTSHSSSRNTSTRNSAVQAAGQRRPPSVPSSERFSRFESNQQQNREQHQGIPIMNLNNPPPSDYLNIQETQTHQPQLLKRFIAIHLPQKFKKFTFKHRRALITIISIVLIGCIRRLFQK